MAKTKEQKQQEALQRKREAFDVKSVRYRNTQPGTPGYDDAKESYGKDRADDLAQREAASFKKYLKEVCLDYHGNVLAWADDVLYVPGQDEVVDELGIDKLIYLLKNRTSKYLGLMLRGGSVKSNRGAINSFLIHNGIEPEN